jgi:hypothetical protein
MQLHLAYGHVPEMTVLPPSVRGLVRRRALAMMPSRRRLICELPVIFSTVGGLLGAFAGAWAACLLHSGSSGLDEINISISIVCNLIGVAVGGLACGFVGMQLQVRKLRPYLSKAVGDYVSEVTHAV